MSRLRERLLPGDLVKVRTPEQIRNTLDQHGRLDGLPFMPEMAEYCGRTFRVRRRVEKACVEGLEGAIGEFPNADVVFLEDLRCSGAAHGGCRRGCMIFWKEAWFEPAGSEVPLDSAAGAAADWIPGEVSDGQGVYYCQSSLLSTATRPLGKSARIAKCFQEVRSKTYGPLAMAGLMAASAARKVLRTMRGPQPAGKRTRTPTESLGLKPGDLVEVKPIEEIVATLDAAAKNRGLEFTPKMARSCGRRYRVKARLDHWIDERTGKMRSLKNTVVLEGSLCGCDYTLGGCPRLEVAYWREIWLRPVENNGNGSI